MLCFLFCNQINSTLFIAIQYARIILVISKLSLLFSVEKKWSEKLEEDRLLMFNKFLNFETKNEEDAYLQSMISVTEVKQAATS